MPRGTDPFTERLRALRQRPDGKKHFPALTEHEPKGTFEVRCSCGEATWTPWGQAHAAEIYAVHLWAKGVVKTVIPLDRLDKIL